MFVTIFALIEQFFPFLVGFIQSTAYPSPLSKEEEVQILQQMKDGNQEARRKLIEHNLRLVVHIVKKFDIKNDNFEDYISIGTIGLIKAIDSFDTSKGLRLTTYASKCIENEILMALRNAKKHNNTISLNDPIGYDKDGNAIQLIDIVKDETIPDILQQMQLNENKEKLIKYIDKLTTQEKRILIQRYGLFNQKVRTQKEIAEVEHISRSYISRIEKRAFVKLLKSFKEE